MDAEVCFRSPAERARFRRELAVAVSGLVRRYHHESAPGGRKHRLVAVAYPIPGDGAAAEAR